MAASVEKNVFCVKDISSYSWLENYLGNTAASWKPISLTYVLYPEGDLVGKVLAWSSMLPIFILVSFVTLILFRRELHTMAFFGGILINEIVNMGLKYSIKSPRPCGRHKFTNIMNEFMSKEVILKHSDITADERKELYNKYGMPSSHAQFMSFFAIYMLFFAYIRLKMHVYEKFMDNIRQHLIAFSSVGASVIVCYSRIYLHYHTLEQVIVGIVVGLVNGAVWFYIVETLFTPIFQDIVNTKIAEYFLIRDSSNIPDILWFEYTSSRTEARQRQRRITQKSQ
ncbi:dolichyldiphosphatase 1-like isoform X1 [Hydractinia symbiolongicarpus]|uniref:dolichyldiphosphatase 1-like isoform X1 n=1 Tax=Hydractinia symbiolongicarpus TaxID=13093 RepID=UPI0025518530|nr:dolichyldiphosphatase 1-like isoform X1 [Hydractinia symbiolongicarpus]XP_057317231.1 dolichyldiphosphatase 1-like isoform X1 [Hydractinia symbiolongicarpus]